jgi:hypothetical protein
MFWTFFLAHLAGDYLLQTDNMVRARHRWTGRVRHVAVHFAVLLLLSGTASLRIWPYLLFLVICHFVIDSLKIAGTDHWPKQMILLYFIDQGVHVALLLFVAAWIERTTGITRDRSWTVYASGYLLVTYVWFITERLLAHENGTYRRQVQAQRWWRMGSRALALTVYLLAGRVVFAAPQPIALAAAPVSAIPYRSGPHRLRTLLVDLLGPLFIAALILLFS